MSASERFSVQAQIIHAIGAIEAELVTRPTEEEVEGYVTAACEEAPGEARQRRIEQIVAEIRSPATPRRCAEEPGEVISADRRGE